MHGLLRDIRHAIRIFLSTPTVTVAAVLTLALGIGANIAMFSIVYGVLLRPLPYQHADRLVLARAEVDYTGANNPVRLSVPWTELKAWDRALNGISALAFYTASDVVALSGDTGSEVLDSAVVSHTFFSTLAGPVAAGRPIDVADGSDPVVVISARLARRLFDGPDGAIGKELPLSRGTFTVIGVADRTFQFPSSDVDVWMSAGSVATDRTFFRVIARLEPDGTVERARAALQPMLQESATARGRKPEEVRTTVVHVSDEMVATVRPALLVLFACVLMVLLIACGNLINLLLARITAREQEFAVRRALGASAGRLVRQLLVESALLAVAGVAGGIVVARLSLVALPRLAGEAVPRLDAVQLDRPALLFAVGLAVLVTFVTGITPALRAARTAAIAHRGASGTATPPGARRLQRSMCIVQVALAVMLLVGATLMGRSLARLLDVDLGVTTDHVLTASLTLAFGKRPPDAETIARIERVIEHVRTLPGVRAVGAGTSLPPSRSRMMLSLRRTGDAVDYQAAAVPATPGYFSALQMRLLNGRFFTEADDDQHPPVVILSEDTAERFFGADDPIGRTMMLPVLKNGTRTSADMTVVGVTANVKYAGLADPPDDVAYRPFKQQPWVAPFLVVRTAGDPADFAPTLQRSIAAVDKGIVVASVATLDQLVLDETAQPQFRAVLLASLATLALAIAAMGLYGVVAYAVSRRTKEIGIRIALGATPREVLAMVLGDGLIVALAGIIVGTASALMLTQALAGLLYGITPTDPMSFIVAAAGLLGLTLVATYFPARRAARIQPVQALRTD